MAECEFGAGAAKKDAAPKPPAADETALSAAAVWQEYERGRSFNEAIGLYSTVEQNENFYIGNQWEGVNAPDLDKPVFNILGRVVRFFLASVMSDDIGVAVAPFAEHAGGAPDSVPGKPVLDMLAAQLDRIMENTAYRKKCREVIRNAAVDGDGCMHFYFDPRADGAGGPYTPGEICAEIVENTDLHFGNPQSAQLQDQPYLLLCFRRLVPDVRRTAAQNGCDPEAVLPDENEDKHGSAPEDGKVTVVRRYWRQDGRVWCCEVTAGGFVRRPWDTGYTRYPLAFFPWEKVKNQYHGQAALTGLIPNQIFINKLYAMAMQHVKSMAFPKIVYNRSLLPRGWDNRVGAAIGVPGDPNLAVASGFRAPDMSAQVLAMIDRVVAETRDTMGASDAALGNIRPDNTSAIIATQKATSMPLELQKQEFYSFVEESVRCWLDMMSANYGVRPVLLGGAGGDGGVPFDFSQLAALRLKLNVEIGAATYWSELMQVQTLDNLFGKNLVDAKTYLENMPRGYIPNRAGLLQSLQAQRQEPSADEALTGALA